MKKALISKKDISTEEKIKEAARKVFTKKGYSATRTRDIAVEADLNLALLNYYFRSKQKLFEIIMIEKMQKFFSILLPVLYDNLSSLETKIESIASSYIDLILENPDLPFFVMSEARNNPEIINKVAQKKDFLKNSVFIRQLKEKKPDLNPYHLLINLLGMCVFPFIMKPILQQISDMGESAFKQMMMERKSLIPIWTRAILRSK